MKKAGFIGLLAAVFLGEAWGEGGEKTPAGFSGVPLDLFRVAEGMEMTVWARSPQLFNPTNIDVDAAGRVWVAEGVRYRRHFDRQPAGDRIMVLEDTNGDGRADSSHVFVQEEALVAPLGVAVFDNRVVVSQPPDLIVYTDVDRNLKFDAAVDKREVLLTGFMGKNHDHSLHSVTAGPDGRWVFNSGNCGAQFTDRSGKTFRIMGPYQPKPIGPFTFPFEPGEAAGKASDDGHTYVGGFTVRINPDGTEAQVIGHNYRNSYEQSVTSFGDVFQNDNDDPPACRVSYVLEYGNAGFASEDGQRTWNADRRPGQTTQVAEWRQEDPGVMPAGDVYGGGSPTGNVFYENGALGKGYEGTFFACEPGRNVIFKYEPELTGAGYLLEREDFVTTNPEREFAGSDFIGGDNSVNDETKTLFRPSDIAVGTDGALYVSDWYDPRVGGHADLDDACSGVIYRIAPKGFKAVVSEIDLETTAGQIEALKSPAVNVRHTGFVRLAAQGEAVVPAVAVLLEDGNRFVRARAVWLLARLGGDGVKRVESLLASEDEMMRVVAYRALRHEGHQFLEMATRMAGDESAAVRREVAVSLRDVGAEESVPILMPLARGYDGGDRTYLEAWGIGCTGKEGIVYGELAKEWGDDVLGWTDAQADLVWRLMVPEAVPALVARASASELSEGPRQVAVDSLAFIEDEAAAEGMIEVASLEGDLRNESATWWLINRVNGPWGEFDLRPRLRAKGILPKGDEELVSIVIPNSAEAPKHLPPVEEILALPGDAARGAELVATRCVMCHEIDGKGVQFGPVLTGWGRTQPSEVIARSILMPEADVSHGFDGHEVVTKDGVTIQGILISEGDPVQIVSMGGKVQMIPATRIASKKKLEGRSLMMSADQLALTAQDVADIVAHMRK